MQRRRNALIESFQELSGVGFFEKRPMKVNIIYRQLSEIVYDTNKKALCGRGGAIGLYRAQGGWRFSLARKKSPDYAK